jgi:hypothetical protein
MTTERINGLKIGTRLRVKGFTDYPASAVIVGPATESWCVKLADGRMFNADINDIYGVDLHDYSDEDIVAAKAAGLCIVMPGEDDAA